jgi:outer membrane lipoprotein-sorting protein
MLCSNRYKVRSVIRKCALAGPLVLLTFAATTTSSFAAAPAAKIDAHTLLQSAFDNWRANSSSTTLTMTVHRPEWERHLTMRSYTRGNDQALVRFTAPAKDAGNATLKLGSQMWIFNPKLNQVIKLPASMVAQPWMGSDFSYNDLAKADDVLVDYSARIISTEPADAHTNYLIEALPNPGAPVVWGKQQIMVRDDGVLLEQTFYDQDLRRVRSMVTDKIAKLDGRNYPVSITMHSAEHGENWTRIETTQGKFNTALPDFLFTQSNLQNPRDQ